MSQQLAKNTLYLTAASVGQKGIAFAYFVLLARVMEPERTGIYFLALSITTIFSVVTDVGITPVVIREVAKRPEEAAGLVRRALWLKIPFMLLAVVGSLAATMLLDYDPIVFQLVLLANFVMLADAVSLLFYGVLRGFHELRYESLGIFVGQTISTVLGGAALLFAPSLFFLVAALLVGSTFNAVYSSFQVARRLGFGALSPQWDTEMNRALLRTALPFALAGVFVKLYSYVDSILISKFIGTTAVGIYAVAYKFTYSFQFLPMAFVAALYPGMSALVGKDHARLSKLFDDAMWYVALLAAPVTFGLWAVAPDAIALAGEGYEEAVPLLRTLIFVLLPIFLDFPIGSLLNASDRQGTKMAIMGVTVVINLALNAVFIPVSGLMGAAYAALASFTFLFVGGLYFVPRMIPGYRLSHLARVVAPILGSGLVMGAAATYLRPAIGFFAVVPVSAVLYVLMLAVTGALRQEHVLRALHLIRPRRYVEDAPVHE